MVKCNIGDGLANDGQVQCYLASCGQGGRQGLKQYVNPSQGLGLDKTTSTFTNYNSEARTPYSTNPISEALFYHHNILEHIRVVSLPPMRRGNWTKPTSSLIDKILFRE